MKWNKRKKTKIWQGHSIKVNILYTHAGVAQHIWVESKNGSILIDAGDGLLRDLLSNGLNPHKIRGIIFTHGHFDHMGGLHTLLGYFRMKSRAKSLSIFAPKGCKEVFSTVYNFKRWYGKTIPFRIFCRQTQPKKTFQIAAMIVKPYPVIHCGYLDGTGVLDQIPAMGYRISYQGEIIAISGDTGLCSSLRELVKGVDLAILEATYGKSGELSKECLEKVHLSEDLAEQVAKSAKEFILVHKGRR
jgi:ribonuclease Z